MKLSSLTMLMYELDVKSCDLMINLLSTCKVMGTYMYITLVGLAWYCEYGIIRFYLK